MRRTEFELRKAEERAHILEGLTLALDHLDAIIAIIRQSEDTDAAKVPRQGPHQAEAACPPGHPAG